MQVKGECKIPREAVERVNVGPVEMFERERERFLSPSNQRKVSTTLSLSTHFTLFPCSACTHITLSFPPLPSTLTLNSFSGQKHEEMNTTSSRVYSMQGRTECSFHMKLIIPHHEVFSFQQ